MPPAVAQPFNSVARKAPVRLQENRTPQWYGLSQQTPVYYARAWTDSRIEQVQHFKEVVYKAVDAIASAASGQRPFVAQAPAPLAFGHRAGKGLTPVMPHEELTPVEETHPLVGLLCDGNSFDTGPDITYETVVYLLLTGSAYWWIPPNALGLPAETWVIPSHWVWPVPGTDKIVDHYEIRAIPGGGSPFKIPESEVIHFRRPSPISKLDGYSPLTAGSMSIDVYESIQRSKFWSFKNGANPGVAIECDADYQDPTDDKIDRIEKKFMARYSGENRANKPMVVPPGFKVRPYTHTPREMEYLASSVHSADEILELFRVPPIVLGRAKDMTYGSVGAAQVGFFTFAVNPLLKWLDTQRTQKLAWRFDRRLRVWTPECTANDPEHREKVIENDLRNGIRSPNEARRERGLAPFPFGGDNPIISAIGVELPYGTGKPSVKAEPLTEPPEPKSKPKPE